MKVKLLSCVQLIATPWTAAYQAPPSMGVSRQEYWSGVPLPSLLVVAGGGTLRCHGLLMVMASLVEHGFQGTRAQQLWLMDPGVLRIQ